MYIDLSLFHIGNIEHLCHTDCFAAFILSMDIETSLLALIKNSPQKSIKLALNINKSCPKSTARKLINVALKIDKTRPKNR